VPVHVSEKTDAPIRSGDLTRNWRRQRTKQREGDAAHWANEVAAVEVLNLKRGRTIRALGIHGQHQRRYPRQIETGTENLCPADTLKHH
jgi:hypothetical protein